VARKDLSRTVIEGGRRYSNCDSRRASHGEHRATTREWLDRVSVDPDAADASDPLPLPRVGKHFHDKLGPAQRWLAAQVGRPWDNVYADICARFDTRTVAGRHVVHDHLLAWVRRWDVPLRYTPRFELVIDRHGILQRSPHQRTSYRKLRQRALALTAGRFAANTYRGWWWFTKEAIDDRCTHVYRCERTHFIVGDVHYHGVRYTGRGALTRAQLGFLFALPAELRSQIVIPSPL
jgi:hypothetical protein